MRNYTPLNIIRSYTKVVLTVSPWPQHKQQREERPVTWHPDFHMLFEHEIIRRKQNCSIMTCGPVQVSVHSFTLWMLRPFFDVVCVTYNTLLSMSFGNIFPLSWFQLLYFSKCSKHCKKKTLRTEQVYGVDKNERYVFVVSGVGEDDGYLGKEDYGMDVGETTVEFATVSLNRQTHCFRSIICSLSGSWVWKPGRRKSLSSLYYIGLEKYIETTNCMSRSYKEKDPSTK